MKANCKSQIAGRFLARQHRGMNLPAWKRTSILLLVLCPAILAMAQQPVERVAPGASIGTLHTGDLILNAGATTCRIHEDSTSGSSRITSEKVRH